MKSQISNKHYMYTISRSDIPLAHQAIQAGHAAIEHAYQYGRSPDHHPSLIHLSARDKDSLIELKSQLTSAGINTAEFHEPYKDWGLTAISCLLHEEQKHMLSHLKLWRLPTQTKENQK